MAERDNENPRVIVTDEAHTPRGHSEKDLEGVVIDNPESSPEPGRQAEIKAKAGDVGQREESVRLASTGGSIGGITAKSE